jgi:hypothetical protein
LPGFCSSDLSPGFTAGENSRRIPYQARFGQIFQDAVDAVVQPELTIINLSLWMIVFLGLTCVVYAVVSMGRENRFGRPLKGIIWFTFAIIVSCAIALLAGYIQKG